jgi:hypothetical protein
MGENALESCDSHIERDVKFDSLRRCNGNLLGILEFDSRFEYLPNPERSALLIVAIVEIGCF